MHKKFMFGFLLGALAGGAGGVMLQKNKRRIKARILYWKLRADIEQQIQSLKKFTREAHDKIVETAVKDYGAKAELSAAKLGLMEIELKAGWRDAKRRFENIVEEKLEDIKEGEEKDDDE